MTSKVAFLVTGSRGDNQPFIPLAQELKLALVQLSMKIPSVVSMSLPYMW